MTRDTIARAWFRAYYPYCRALNRAFPGITLEGKRLQVSPSVHKPMDNVHRIVEFIPSNGRVLDLGCGSGVIALFAAAKSASVTATDVNAEAVEDARRNFATHGVSNAVAVRSDMFESIDGRFDTIVANPPFFNLAFSDPRHQWATSATYLERLFEGAPDHLAEGGQLLLMFPAAEHDRLTELAAAANMSETLCEPVPKRKLALAAMSALYLQLIPELNIFRYQAK